MKRTQAIIEIKEVEDQQVIVLPESVIIVIKQKGQNGQHGQANMTRTTDNVILMCAKPIDITDMNFWVCDSGASCHVTSSIKFMYDLKDVHQEIEVADGN